MTVNNFTQEKITRLISLGIVISFIQSILTGFNQHLKNCNAENLSLRLRCLMVDNIILSKYHTAFNFTPGLFSAVVINETTEFSTIVIELISNIVILPITIVTAISIMIWLNQYNVQTLGKFFTYLASHSSFIEGSVIENIQFFDESVSCDRINKMSKLLGFDDFFLQLAGRI